MLTRLLSGIATEMGQGDTSVELVLGDDGRTIRVTTEGELNAQLVALARAGWELTTIHQDGPTGVSLTFRHPII